MLKQLLAATAMITIGAAAASAQAVNTDNSTTAATPAVTAPAAPGDIFLPAAAASDRLASKLMGVAVYDGTSNDANKIGTVNDLVIADNGSVEAVIVGVGGFLGIGQKNVALDYPNLQWNSRDGGPVLVAAISKDDLSNAPSFDTAAIDNSQVPATNGLVPAAETAALPAAGTSADQTQPADQSQMAAQQPTAPANGATVGTPPTDQTQMATQAPAAGSTSVNGTAAPTDQTQMAQQNTAPVAGTNATVPNAADLTAVDLASITAKDLMNATVYSATNENVGNVGDVVLGQDGKIDALVLDVGGFLGLGTKPVAIGFDSLDIRKDANGGLFIYTHFTKDQLESAPNYDKDQYATQRDVMRLSNPS